ncbi:MAG: alpha-mannosidase [Oscillospiraceae bacterium]|nr:alpha-mannosidase [Oscillospiraceae bacterium]
MHYTSRIILDNKLSMLKSMIYQDIHPIDRWETRELLYPEALRFEPVDDWHPIAVGSHWFSQFDHTQLFRAVVTIPESFAGRQPLLVLDLGGEGQIRIDGEIVSGIVSYENKRDGLGLFRQNRSRVVVPARYGPGDSFTVEAECCLNFLDTGYNLTDKQNSPVVEYTLNTAFLAVADEELEGYTFDLATVMEAIDCFANPLATFESSNARVLNGTVHQMMKALNADSYLQEKLFAAAMASVNELLLECGYEELKASLPAAAAALKEGLAAIPHKAHAMVKFVGHSHIDTAWLWPLKESVRKCGKTFSNVLDLMDRYPEFIFACSQPQLFAYTEEFYPELFEKIKQRVAEGRIELVGNAWVEMDTNVPGGEALVRQLLYGRQYYLEKFGRASRVFWMPDVFGYSWALPQIMKRSGVEYFFTSKLGNNDTNNFPHSLFHWQGVDGTKILSFLQPLGYNGETGPGHISEAYYYQKQKDVYPVSLAPVGYGDGGGGPNYQMLETARRSKELPGLPRAEFATAESFFREAEAVQDQLPVWNDEMYYEFHRGTYSSQSETKKNNRKGELLLRRTEMACAMAAALTGCDYPARAIGKLWKAVLTNQFHDILPGSSIHQVYEDCDVIYARTFAQANALFDEAITALNTHIGVGDDQLAVWNFLGWPVTGTVCAALTGSFAALTDEDGRAVNAVVTAGETGTEFLFEAQNIPAMGVKVFTAVGKAAEAAAALPVLENAHLRVTLDENGNIISLYDKHANREAFAEGTRSNLLTVFEDIPHRESAWNIDLEYQNRFWELDKAESVEVAETSSVRSVVRVVRKFRNSTITQDIVLERDARRVDFITHVDWQEKQRMLKTTFWPDVLAGKATYEIQFGAIERPTHWNTSYDKARFEVCGHKWADLSEGGFGVSILNDCKYGYDIKDNRMRLTLLRGTVYPDPTGDIGEHDFTYSILPHSGDWRCGDTVRHAYALNVPALPTAGCGEGKARGFSFAAVPNANVILETIKGAEDGDGLIVRVYESQGARGKAVIDFGFALKDAAECNLMEVYEKELPVDGSSLHFYIKPYEIKTFRVRPV